MSYLSAGAKVINTKIDLRFDLLSPILRGNFRAKRLSYIRVIFTLNTCLPTAKTLTKCCHKSPVEGQEKDKEKF